MKIIPEASYAASHPMVLGAPDKFLEEFLGGCASCGGSAFFCAASIARGVVVLVRVVGGGGAGDGGAG